MNPRVRAVEPTDDYQLRLVFTNGEVGVYDCRHLLDFGVFQQFKDVAYFKLASVSQGTVVWPNEQDICPDTLYEDSKCVGRAMAEQTVAVERRNEACSDGKPTHAAD